MAPVTQRTFIRGVDASTSKYDQPKGSLPQLSNLVMTRRGSLITCDGSTPLITPSFKFNPSMSSQGAIVAIRAFLAPVGTIVGSPNTPSGSFLLAGSGFNVTLAGSIVSWSSTSNVTRLDGQYASLVFSASSNQAGPGTASAANDAGGGTVAWSSITTPGPSAQAGLTQIDTSDNLHGTGYGFNLPSNAVVVGIKLKVGTPNAPLITDFSVRLLDAGTATGANRANGNSWTGVQTYGSSSDLWGQVAGFWTPAKINNSGFGATVSAQNIGTSNHIAYITGYTITVYYTIAASGYSDYLCATGFGLNIPTGATIQGIQFKVYAFDAMNSGAVTDKHIFLINGPGPTIPIAGCVDHAGALTWGATLIGYTVGGAADTWSVGPNPAMVNDPSFGIAISVQSSGAASAKPSVDVIEVAITYTGGAGGSVLVSSAQVIFYLQDPNPGDTLPEVTGLVSTPHTTGGTLADATYNYEVSSMDGRQDSSAGVAVNATVAGGGGNGSVTLTWNVVAGAGSYLIWKKVAGVFVPYDQVFQPLFQQPVPGGTTASYIDTGTPSAAFGTNLPVGTQILGTNSTLGALHLYKSVGINPTNLQFADPVQLALFPCRSNDRLIPAIPPVAASGGLLGASSQVPDLLQFSGFMVVALGNGFPIHYTDGNTVFPLTNTFTAQFINWQASTTYLVGDMVQATVAGTAYIFTCQQQGQSQTPGPPAWTATLGQIVIDGQVQWKNTGQVTTSPIPPGGAHVAYHAGSLWVFNNNPSNTSDGLHGQSSLRMSDTNNIKSWNPLNVAFIGKDDGSDGMGMASFTIAELGIAPLGSLILFKDFTTYQVVGVFGSPNFSIQQLQTDMGCSAPRTIKFLSGYGIARLTHLGVALLDGVRDRLISESVRPFIFGAPAVQSQGVAAITGIDLPHAYLCKADQVAVPPMYCIAAPLQGNVSLNRIFLYDLVLKSWLIIDLPATINPTSYIASICQTRGQEFQPLTLIGGFDNSSIQVIQHGDALWNLVSGGQAVSWAFTTPEVFNSQDMTAPIHAGQLFIKGVNLDGNPITVTINLQTETGWIADTRTYAVGQGDFEIVAGINEECLSVNAAVSGSGRVSIDACMWDVTPLRGGVPYQIT